MCCFTLGLNWLIQYSAKLESHLRLLFGENSILQESVQQRLPTAAACVVDSRVACLQLQWSCLPIAAATYRGLLQQLLSSYLQDRLQQWLTVGLPVQRLTAAASCPAVVRPACSNCRLQQRHYLAGSTAAAAHCLAACIAGLGKACSGDSLHGCLLQYVSGLPAVTANCPATCSSSSLYDRLRQLQFVPRLAAAAACSAAHAAAASRASCDCWQHQRVVTCSICLVCQLYQLTGACWVSIYKYLSDEQTYLSYSQHVCTGKYFYFFLHCLHIYTVWLVTNA